MPALDREVCRQAVTGQDVGNRLLRGYGSVVGGRVEEQLAAAIGADHHLAAELTVDLVLDLVRAEVRGGLAGLPAPMQPDGYPPVVVVGFGHARGRVILLSHGRDSTAVAVAPTHWLRRAPIRACSLPHRLWHSARHDDSHHLVAARFAASRSTA